MSDFNLSSKGNNIDDNFTVTYSENDVKKFIRRLKDKCCDCNQIDGECKFCIYIRELAGEELI